jgi:hypothetical protein
LVVRLQRAQKWVEIVPSFSTCTATYSSAAIDASANGSSDGRADCSADSSTDGCTYSCADWRSTDGFPNSGINSCTDCGTNDCTDRAAADASAAMRRKGP